MSDSERMKEPGSFAGGAKVDEAWYGLVRGRRGRERPQDLRCKSGRGQSQVGLVYGCDGYVLCAFICKKGRKEKEAHLFIKIRTTNGGIGAGREERRKLAHRSQRIAQEA